MQNNAVWLITFDATQRLLVSIHKNNLTGNKLEDGNVSWIAPDKGDVRDLLKQYNSVMD